MSSTANVSSEVLNHTLSPIREANISFATTPESGIVWCPLKNNTEQDDAHFQFLKTAQFVTGLLVYPIFCFPGLVGNMLTVIVLSRRNMLTSTNAFLSALAVSDSIKLINDILYFFVILFSRIDPQLGNKAHGYLYPYAHFVFNMSVCVSSWLTVSVAVERYILVCMPTRARAVWSRRRAVMLCTFIYFVMTSLALPSALRYRTIHCVDRNTSLPRLDVELTELWKSNSFVISYTWAQNLLRSIIPLFILVVLNTCIIYVLSHTKARRRRNSRHRVTIMMIVVILAFLICITPDAILSTVFDFGYYEASNLTRAIREITDALLTINAAINFLIYCAFNQVFRKSFAQLCRSPRRTSGGTSGLGWVTEMDESTYRRLSEAQTPILSNNNCSPRLDSPPTTISDHSPGGYFSSSSPASTISSPKLPDQQLLSERRCCDGKDDLTKVYDCHHREHDHFQKIVANGGCSITSDLRNSGQLNLDNASSHSLLSPHHHHCLEPRRRGLSHGLKKSKNSLKRGRHARAHSIKKKGGRLPETVTYIPSDSYSPSSCFRSDSPPPSLPASRNTSSSRSQQRSDGIHSQTSPTSSSSHLSSSPQAGTDGDEMENNTRTSVPAHAPKTALSSNGSLEIMVFKEPSASSAANENVPRNNEPSSAFKDASLEDKNVDAKHLNMNMINNDLSPVPSILCAKTGKMKESNIHRPDKAGPGKKKVALTVSFSDENTS